MEQELVVERAPVIVAPFHITPQSPEQFAEGHNTVTMEFPKDVHLTVANNLTVYYSKGLHEVPEQHADHWFLEANGARPYARKQAVKANVNKKKADGEGDPDQK